LIEGEEPNPCFGSKIPAKVTVLRRRIVGPLVWAVALVTVSTLALGQASDPSHPSPASPSTAPPKSEELPPSARTVDVVEDLYGIKVPDAYRWMEGNDNPEFSSWLRAQGAYTETYLAGIPGRDKIFRRVRELGLSTSGVFGMQIAGGRAFYLALGPGEQLRKLVVRRPDGKETVLVDPAAKSVGSTHASVNSFSPSPDGRLVAYDLSTGGSELSAIHVIDADSGVELPDTVERIWGEFPASWFPQGEGFFYTQMAPASDADPLLNMQVRMHRLGQPVSSDVLVLAGDRAPAMRCAPEEFPTITAIPGTGWLIASAGGAHSNSRFAVVSTTKLDRSGSAKTAWVPVATYDDDVEGAAIHGDRLYLLTYKGASNRRIVSVPLAEPKLASARVEIAEDQNATIVGIAQARDALYVQQMIAGRARLLRTAWGSHSASPLPLPREGWIDVLATDPLGDGAWFDLKTWTVPDTYYEYRPSTKKVEPTGIATTTAADFSGIASEEVEATSFDGTHVPLSILHRRDLALDRSHPTILIGYGAYGISETPFFVPWWLAWLERGGVIADAHVRGGGEKGDRWHVDGSHEHKMNGIRDFIACADYLVEKDFTTPSLLFAEGGSAGGVLIGRVITERPDRFAAAHIAVGMVNPLRLLAAENGANQMVEFGNPESEAGFRSTHEVDPYAHVAPHTAYPAVIFTIGLNDRRVAPWMTGKMAARLQASTSSGKPVLVRIDPDAGHGVGSTRDQAYAQTADVWSFLLSVARDPDFVGK